MAKKRYVLVCLEFPDRVSDDDAAVRVENFVDLMDTITTFAQVKIGFEIAEPGEGEVMAAVTGELM